MVREESVQEDAGMLREPDTEARHSRRSSRPVEDEALLRHGHLPTITQLRLKNHDSAGRLEESKMELATTLLG